MRHLAVYGLYLLGIGAAARLGFWQPTFLTKWRSRVVVAGILALFAAAVTAMTSTPWFGDFESAYYPAGQLIASDPERLYGEDCTAGFVNIPVIAIAFAGLSTLEYTTAVTTFTIAGVAAALASMCLLMSMWARDSTDRLRIAALFAVNGPLMYSIREGNTTHIVLLLVTLAFSFFSYGGGLLAGILLGVATAIKLPLGLFGIYFVLRRQWWALFGYAVSGAVITGLSLAIYGMHLHGLWYERCVVPYSGKPMPGFNVQSVHGFLARWYGGDVFTWAPLALGGSFPIVRTIIIGALLALVGIVWLRIARPVHIADFHLEMSVILLISLLIFPLSWTHYYLFLLIPLTLFATGRIALPANGFWTALAVVAAIAVSLPLRSVQAWNPVLNVIIDRFLISHYMFGGLLLLGVLLKTRCQTNAVLPDTGPCAVGMASGLLSSNRISVRSEYN